MNINAKPNLKELCNAALELAAHERAAFLDVACDGDARLRAEIESLLAHEDTARDFLAQPAWQEVVAQIQTEPQEDLTGTQLDRYEIRTRIGAGGMGEVWKAWDPKLRREVAIKILPAEFAADPERIARFQQEARAASALKHPNIITIYEDGQVTMPDGALHFIVTEFVEGQTLRDYLAQPNRSWREGVRIATQIASALTAAHTADLIHRDIKPENIMVQPDGQVKVLDFGIAKGLRIADCGLRIAEAETLPTAQGDSPSPQDIPHSAICIPQLTMPGARLGTIRYMSPEQARGEALDARTDIFSCGLVLYELLTGQRPYGNAQEDEMMRQLMDAREIEPVSKRLPNLPAALDRIVTRALRKNREERYAAASEMLSDLQQLRINREEKGLRRLRTNSANQMLTQFVVRYDEDKTTRIPLGGLWTIGRFADLPRGKLERELIRKSRWNVLWRLGGLALGIAAVTLMIAAWASVTETWEEKVLRDGHTAAVRRAVFSPDGTKLVSVGEDKQVIVWDFAKRERLATFTDHQDWVTTVAFSPNGKWFATASSDGTVIVWDAARLAKAAVLPGRHGVVRTIAFAADGRTLVTPTDDDRKNIWEVGSWRKLREVRTDGFQQGHFLLSLDGRWMMVPFGDTYELGVTPAINDTRPYFWGGSAPITKDTHPPHWSWAALAPDGRRIISIDGGGFVAFSEIVRFSHPTERKLVSYQRMHQDSGRAVAFSPDGRLAASGAEDIVLWDALTHKKLGRFRHQVGVSSLAFSPDGH
jgi:serine/threonine protein kinase